MRVLVAEDKPRMARLMQRALTSEGYSVSLASDGEQALSIGLLGGLDVIVLDVMLPRRSGFDVIRGLRAAKPVGVLADQAFLAELLVVARCSGGEEAVEPARAVCSLFPHGTWAS